MAAGEVLAGVAAITGTFGSIISAMALFRNGGDESDREIDRMIKRRMKIKLLEELGDPDEPPDNVRRLDIRRQLIGLSLAQFWLRWMRWAS